MSQDYEQYERLVDQIAQEVADRLKSKGRVEHKKPGRSNKIVGASGHEHQIDVSLTFFPTDAPARLIVVECKKWNSTVGIDSVLTFFARIRDIQERCQDFIVEGVFLTTMGFEEGAKTFANYYGIHLDIVRSLEEWAIKLVDQLVIQPRPATTTISVVDPIVSISAFSDETEIDHSA
jgi:hypothetical protein